MIVSGKKSLFLEFDNSSILIAVGEYDEELNFKIISKNLINFIGIQNGKINSFEKSVSILKKEINKIENESNLFFESANVIINLHDLDCINISGFKKLNGNQILVNDISYIINNIKSKIEESEKNKSLIHIFNTKFLLDGKLIKNLPIGLYGDFYSHQLTFFLANNDYIKNISKLLNKCNLSLNKVVLKSFIDGIEIDNRNNKKTFFRINLKKEETELIFFYESSFCFFQSFNFGTDMIIKDISKVCKLDISDVKNFIYDTKNKNTLNENSILDQKYFKKSKYKKISLSIITEVALARIKEILSVIYKQNKNIDYFKLEKNIIDMTIEDRDIFTKFKTEFIEDLNNCELKYQFLSEVDRSNSIKIFGDLICKGWANEAIPVTHEKKSWISRVFSSIFE